MHRWCWKAGGLLYIWEDNTVKRTNCNTWKTWRKVTGVDKWKFHMFYFSTFFSFTKAFKFIPWTDTGLFLLREFRCLGEHVASCLVIRYHVFLTAFCRVSVFIIYSCEGGCTGHLLALFWAHTIKMVLAFLLYNWTNKFFSIYVQLWMR